MHTRSGAAIAAIAAVAVLVPATPSLAAWTNPFPVNSVNGDASSPSIGIDATGKAVIAYREAGGGLFVNTRGPDGTVGTTAPVNQSPSGPPSIATNAGSSSAIVWQQSDGANSRMHFRLRRPAGDFSADTTVSQAGIDVNSLEVAIDAAGNVLMSWGANVGGLNRTFLRFRSAGGVLGPIVPISPASNNAVQPHLALESGGRAFVTWVATDAQNKTTVWGELRKGDGTFSTPVALSGTGAVDDVAVAIDGTGKALVAWRQTIGGELLAQARTRAFNGTLTPITTLSGAGANVAEMEAAIGHTGDVGTVAWRRPVGTDTRVQSRRIEAGTWKGLQNISPAGMNALELRLLMSGDGGLSTYAFTTLENGGSVQRLRARTRRADGSFSGSDIVSADNGLGATNPRLAMNAAGRAGASWRQQRDDTQGDLIWVGTNFV